MSNGRPKKRQILTFEPSGPVLAMVNHETRGKARGAKSRLFEEALAALLGAKYPKLKERWDILREESAA